MSGLFFVFCGALNKKLNERHDVAVFLGYFKKG
jgi:hypothetical protein